MEISKITEVAVAVLQRSDGYFLLAQRPPGKVWAGYWEFPGGKVEAGETTRDALVRELHEELSVIVKTANPWITRVFTYPHATVRLNFFRVTEWRGQLQPLEGQQLAWLQVSDVTVSPVLPANVPIFRALELPPLYGISNAAELGVTEFLRRLEVALMNGLRLVQLREKTFTRTQMKMLAQQAVKLARQYDAKLLLNGDVELAQEIGADGVQLTARQLAKLRERPKVNWCAASCHSAVELHYAEKLGCDFALLSPVLATQSHPSAPHLGWEKFMEISKNSTIPIYALGGLKHDDMQIAWQYGAHGVALLRQAW